MALIDNDEAERNIEAYQMAGQFSRGQVDYEYIPSGIISQLVIPEIGKATANLMAAIMNERSLVPIELKMLMAHMTCYAVGCTCCQTDTFEAAQNSSSSGEEFAKIRECKTSETFTEAERAALDPALAATASPSAVTEELRDNLKIIMDSLNARKSWRSLRCSRTSRPGTIPMARVSMST